MTEDATFSADISWPLWDPEPLPNAFSLDIEPGASLSTAVVTSVTRPWLFGYHPAPSATPNARAVLILGGGGYVQLMVGREGIDIAHWLASLGFHAFVLVHRFPTAETGPQAPVDDARRAMSFIADSGLAPAGTGIVGLSSGGHLGAALLSNYPAAWAYAGSTESPRPMFAVIGYGPISTNAAGRTIVPNKQPLEPPAKQELYDIVQPDVQLVSPAPPTFIVYSGNDPVVPVVNGYRLAEGITNASGSVEMHVFADAPHGFAIDTKGLPVSNWPALCEAWMKQIGVLEPGY